MDGGRYCDACGHEHGDLYICDSYAPELKAQISADSDRFIRNLNDPEWIARQIANGVPPEVIAIMQGLAS